jgi:hypothetical protein
MREMKGMTSFCLSSPAPGALGVRAWNSRDTTTGYELWEQKQTSRNFTSGLIIRLDSFIFKILVVSCDEEESLFIMRGFSFSSYSNVMM